MIPYGVKNSVFILGLNCFQNGSMTAGQFSVVDSLVGAPPDRQLLNLGVFNQLIEVRKPSSPHQMKMELQVGFVGTDRIHSCAVIKVIAELNQLGYRLWLRALRRRSQRHRITGERMNRLAARWLPALRVVHPYPEQRLRVTT